ncbi:MAG: hypothetical protein F6K30_30150 [Cyanothece sp. SIO2G6]|nr:hypothetical protein [Cyanothece sp. SIO2G6]
MGSLTERVLFKNSEKISTQGRAIAKRQMLTLEAWNCYSITICLHAESRESMPTRS